MIRSFNFMVLLILAGNGFAQFEHSRVYSTFDNLDLVKTDTFDNGADLSGSIDHYGRHFLQEYNSTWGTWAGWSLSNMRNDSTGGYSNQYSAIAGSGLSKTDNYLVAYEHPVIVMDQATWISGAYICNSSYGYFDMLNGSGFSKKFGGEDGMDPDYFFVTVKMYLNGSFVDSSDFYLADFRFTDSNKDYVLKDWVFWDFNNDTENDVLTDSLVFSFQSSDIGQFGINTPTTFCMDDFNALSHLALVENTYDLMGETIYNGSDQAGGFLFGYLFFPNSYNSTFDIWTGWSMSLENDDTTQGFTNLYSPIASGNEYTNTVLINYGESNSLRTPCFAEKDDGLLFKTTPPPPYPLIISVTNTTYAYFDMLNGSNFSKKFGGASGNDPDYFRLIMNWHDLEDSIVHTDTIYLADFRFENNAEDYILQTWKKVKTEDEIFANAHRIVFKLESTDTGQFGMNTPATFAISFKYDVPSAIENPEQPSLKIYPNPCSELLFVEGEPAITSLEMYSMQGEYLKGSKDASLDVSDFKAGMYILYIYSEQGIFTQKIMVP